jgi:hypothetical protein
LIISDFDIRASNLSAQAGVVGLDGVEPSTSRLSGVRSNQTELQAPGYFGLRPAQVSHVLSRVDLGFWIHIF